MTDLTALSESELNIRVAQHLGYIVTKLERNWIAISDPDGMFNDEINVGALLKPNPGDYHWYKEWAMDMNSAVDLFAQIPGGEIEVDHNQWLVSAYGLNPQASEEGDLSNEALARCIVLMWLEWKESEGKP